MLFFALLVALASSKMSQAAWFYNQTKPVLASAGSGQYPQGSILAVTDAYLNGADLIQVSVQMSSDGILIINDRVCLSNSTNALTVFPKSPLKSKNFKSYNCTADLLIPDFTLAQLKSLKRVQ
jgi:glycerophosphoryl diester phosphodiesterase